MTSLGWSASSSPSYYARTRNSALLLAMLFLACAPSYTRAQAPAGARVVSSGRSASELVQALRQCDGAHVQCIVMVRDDFWMAATRFLRDLEIHLLEGQNSAAVDLFDPDHARKVLAAFGRAFGKLSENSGITSKDQKEFLAQAVAGLAQEGKVISVRLALFAEMMKGKAWTPATLKEVGGTEVTVKETALAID